MVTKLAAILAFFCVSIVIEYAHGAPLKARKREIIVDQGGFYLGGGANNNIREPSQLFDIGGVMANPWINPYTHVLNRPRAVVPVGTLGGVPLPPPPPPQPVPGPAPPVPQFNQQQYSQPPQFNQQQYSQPPQPPQFNQQQYSQPPQFNQQQYSQPPQFNQQQYSQPPQPPQFNQQQYSQPPQFNQQQYSQPPQPPQFDQQQYSQPPQFDQQQYSQPPQFDQKQYSQPPQQQEYASVPLPSFAPQQFQQPQPQPQPQPQSQPQPQPQPQPAFFQNPSSDNFRSQLPAQQQSQFGMQSQQNQVGPIPVGQQFPVSQQSASPKQMQPFTAVFTPGEPVQFKLGLPDDFATGHYTKLN